MKTFKTAKGTDIPLMNLKGKDYLSVQGRVLWFREEHPDWSIETEVKYTGDWCVGRAAVKDATGKVMATGHKYEDAKGFGDFIEKSETGAIGRALALCGYGTQFATELEEGERIVDAPVGGYTNAPPPQAAPPMQTPRASPEYVFQYLKKIKGTALGDCDQHELRSYTTWARAQEKPPQGNFLKEVEVIEGWLGQ